VCGFFLAIHLEKYYKIPKLEVHLVKLFVEEFHEKHDVKKILTNWWKEDKRFFHKADGSYSITNLREPYVYTPWL
jgi:hypothetical protein